MKILIDNHAGFSKLLDLGDPSNKIVIRKEGGLDIYEGNTIYQIPFNNQDFTIKSGGSNG